MLGGFYLGLGERMEEFLNQLEATIEALSSIYVPCIACTSSLLGVSIGGIIAYFSQTRASDKKREWEIDDQRREWQKNRLNDMGEHLDGVSRLMYQANYNYAQERLDAANTNIDELFREYVGLTYKPSMLIDRKLGRLYSELMMATQKFDITSEHHEQQLDDIFTAYLVTVKRFDELVNEIYK